jgi:hypothetical protein
MEKHGAVSEQAGLGTEFEFTEASGRVAEGAVLYQKALDTLYRPTRGACY